MNPPSGMEPTPVDGSPIQFCCPRCGFAFPKFAGKVEESTALISRNQDRLADTVRMERQPEPEPEDPFE